MNHDFPAASRCSASGETNLPSARSNEGTLRLSRSPSVSLNSAKHRDCHYLVVNGISLFGNLLGTTHYQGIWAEENRLGQKSFYCCRLGFIHQYRQSERFLRCSSREKGVKTPLVVPCCLLVEGFHHYLRSLLI